MYFNKTDIQKNKKWRHETHFCAVSVLCFLHFPMISEKTTFRASINHIPVHVRLLMLQYGRLVLNINCFKSGLLKLAIVIFSSFKNLIYILFMLSYYLNFKHDYYGFDTSCSSTDIPSLHLSNEVFKPRKICVSFFTQLSYLHR